MNLDKKSPQYTDCDTIINLGFSGLTAYWKPKTMINLVQFINQEKKESSKKHKNNPNQSMIGNNPNQSMREAVADEFKPAKIAANMKDLAANSQKMQTKV